MTRRAEVTIRELKLHTSQILKRVRENDESFAITHRGRVIAHLVPILDPTPTEELAGVWMTVDELAAEIAASSPPGATASDAVARQRP
jgi:prevent-host-death family protein